MVIDDLDLHRLDVVEFRLIILLVLGNDLLHLVKALLNEGGRLANILRQLLRYMYQPR